MRKSGVFIFCLLFFMFGAFAGISWHVKRPVSYCALFAATVLVSLIYKINNFKMRAACLAAICLFAGFARGELSFHQSQYQQFYGQKIILQGYIVEDPETTLFSTKFTVLPKLAGPRALQEFKQKITVTTQGKNYAYGDYIYLVGKLKQPAITSDFDELDYLRAKNTYAELNYPEIYVLSKHKLNYMVYFSLQFKHLLFAQIKRNLPNQQAALLISILTGYKGYLTAQNIQFFNLSGLAHMIAVSGYKLTLVLIGLDAFIPYLGRKKVLVLSAGFTLIYAVMANFAPAVMRAVIMSSVFVLAKWLGRKYYIVPVLVLTAAMLVLANPLIIKYDLGFILSFSGIIGIVLFSPLLQRAGQYLPHTLKIREIFISTAAAQIATTPIMIFYFHQFSLIAPLTNLLVTPLLAPSIMLGYVCAIPALGKIAGYFMVVPLDYVLFIVRNAMLLHFAAFVLKIGWKAFLGAYIVEAGCYFFIFRPLARRLAIEK